MYTKIFPNPLDKPDIVVYTYYVVSNGAATPKQPRRRKMKKVNLYGEDGIAIYLDSYGDLCDRKDATVRVIGHATYTCSADDAEQKIQRAYAARCATK